MDLGFGGSNQQFGSAAANAILQSTIQQERAVENEMAAYDAVLTDEQALQALRVRRLQEMRHRKEQEAVWSQQGHGVYSELSPGGQVSTDTAKEFFKASKASDRLCVHFYRPTTRICDIMHAHLEKLAAVHKETRFCKINVETAEQGGGAAYLVEQLGIVILPTVLIVRNRKAVHHIRGFDELGATEDFSQSSLARLIASHDGLSLTEDERCDDDDCADHGRSGVNSMSLHTSGSGGGASRGGYSRNGEDYD
jgi:hypothetical protein